MIIEKSTSLYSPAALSVGRYGVKLLERFTSLGMPQTIKNTGIIHFDVDGNITKTEPLPRAAEGIETGSWNEVYQCLRKDIEQGGLHWITGSVVVKNGARVIEVINKGDHLDVRYEDQKGAHVASADIVVAADGAYSLVRQSLSHDKAVLPQYSGYVAWRTTLCNEDDLPHFNLQNVVEGKIGFYTMPDQRSYFIL